MSYTTKHKPYRKTSHRHIRFQFARAHCGWTFNNWKHAILSNESHFEVFNRKNRCYVRRFPSEANKPFCFQPRIQGGGGSISVWGAMTAKGVGPLVFYDGRINSRSYINIIKPVLLPYIKNNFKDYDKYYFVQDNASCHNSRFTMNWFNKHKVNILKWPATSPDLNPTENLWDIIDKKLTNYYLTTVNDLQQAILKLWLEIPVETCENLVQLMPRRINSCISAKGNCFSKY